MSHPFPFARQSLFLNKRRDSEIGEQSRVERHKLFAQPLDDVARVTLSGNAHLEALFVVGRKVGGETSLRRRRGVSLAVSRNGHLRPIDWTARLRPGGVSNPTHPAHRFLLVLVQTPITFPRNFSTPVFVA
jgi:hypothetical protein